MTYEQELKEFNLQYKRMIQIGKVVSVIDVEHPSYIDELFLVIGFQPTIYGTEDIAAIMDNKGRVFLVQLEHIILKDIFTIDDMFPSEPTDIMWLNKNEIQ